MTNEEKLSNLMEALDHETDRADRIDLLLQAILYSNLVLLKWNNE